MPISPATRDLLDQTLPTVEDASVEALIDQRATSFVRAIEGGNINGSPPLHGETLSGGMYDGAAGGNGQGRGQVVVQFFEKKRRKTYFFGRHDEDVCWETWTLDVTCATPRNQTGMAVPFRIVCFSF